MGLTSSGDEFCRRTDAALAAIPNVKKLVDDVLVYGQTKQELLKTIRLVFEKCREWNITLSDKKFQFGNEVKFAGFILNESGSSRTPINSLPSGTSLLQKIEPIFEVGWDFWTNFPRTLQI